MRNVFTEAALEFRQQLCRQREARSLMVTAVLRQQITLGIYRLVKIERRNTAAAALGNAVVQAYQNVGRWYLSTRCEATIPITP